MAAQERVQLPDTILEELAGEKNRNAALHEKLAQLTSSPQVEHERAERGAPADGHGARAGRYAPPQPARGQYVLSRSKGKLHLHKPNHAVKERTPVGSN